MGTNKRDYLVEHELNQIVKVPKFHSEKEVLTKIRFGKGYIMFTTDDYSPTPLDLARDVIE